jgi:hypothetical protein
MKKVFCLVLCTLIVWLSGCSYSNATTDVSRQQQVTETLTDSQSTPTDIDYSLERYNLIKRAYWVNGQREKAMSLPCAVERPLGYVVLLTESGAVIGSFVVDGKISSLNSFLTPNYIEQYYMEGGVVNTELADVDGSYGENDGGIFFFTVDGKYCEYNGTYLYSDIPFEVEDPVVKYEVLK